MAAKHEYEQLRRRLGILVDAGLGTTPVAERVRQQLERLWYHLTPAEQAEVGRGKG